MSKDKKSTNKPIDKPMTDTTKEQKKDKSVEVSAKSTVSPKSVRPDSKQRSNPVSKSVSSNETSEGETKKIDQPKADSKTVVTANKAEPNKASDDKNSTNKDAEKADRKADKEKIEQPKSDSTKKNGPSKKNDSLEKEEKPKKKSKLGIFILILIIFLLAFFGGGYLAYTYIETQNSERNQAQTSSINTELEAISKQFSVLELANQNAQRNQRSLQTSLVALQSESERQMQALAQRISSRESTGAADWTLAEVEYLLNIANQRLATSQDAVTAIRMLEQADSILFELAYPELTPARRQISEDLTALRLNKKVDTEGLYFELDSFTNQLVTLTDFSPEFISAPEPSVVETDVWYLKLWGGLSNAFSSLVRVDTEMGEPEYLVTDEQATSRQLSIQLQLRQAQLALLSGEQSVYQGALNSAANELNRFYANNQQATAMSDRLNELSNIIVNADEMNINGSIRTLSSVVDQLAKAGNPAEAE